MKVRYLYTCLFLLIGFLLPNFLLGQVEKLPQGMGELTISFGTNIKSPSGQRVYFTNKGNAGLDFSGIDRPQVIVSFEKLKWNDKIADNKPQFVVLNSWVNEVNGVMKKVSKANVKFKSGKRKLNFEPIKNGKAKIRIEYGIMTANETDIKKVSRVGTFTKEFSILGVGAPAGAPEPVKPIEPVKTTPIPTKPVAAPKPVVEKDKEEEFWNEVKEAKSYSMLKTYLEEFSSGKYVSEAKTRIKATKVKFDIEEKEEKEDGSYYYKIKLLDAEDLSLGSYDEEVLDPRISGNILEVSILPPVSSQKLTVNGDYGRSVEIPLDPEVTLLYAIFKENEESVEYEIQGGTPPYFIRLVDATTDRWVCDNQRLPDAKGKIIKKEWMEGQCAGLDGQYKIELQDRTKVLTKYIEGIYAFKGESSNAILFILGFLILLPLIGGLMWYRSKQQKEKKRLEYEAKLKQKKQAAKEAEKAAPVVEAKAPAAPVETKEPSVETPVIAENIDAHRTKINVKRKQHTQSGTPKTKLGGNKGTQYLEIPMAAKWKDSAIHEVCMSKSTIIDIDDFIRTENRQGIDEDSSAVPEIGGFLLGNYDYIEDKDHYQVYLEKFVPITPDQNDVYKVEFGANAWIELDTVKDEYPDYVIIGWFHTHPGHSLFLSQPDLKIHEGFFKQKFQLAMEIDTLSENLDTGFFTRTKEGVINNTRDSLPGAGWFSWSDIEKFRRKK